jgi:hypothetical protein
MAAQVGLSGPCTPSGASIPLSLRAVCSVMVAAVTYRGSLIALLSICSATVHQCSSRCSGVNSPITRTASPRVATAPSLQTSGANQSCFLPDPARGGGRKLKVDTLENRGAIIYNPFHDVAMSAFNKTCGHVEKWPGFRYTVDTDY